MESVMLDIMYTIPSNDSISTYTITKEIVDKNLQIEDENLIEDKESGQEDLAS